MSIISRPPTSGGGGGITQEQLNQLVSDGELSAAQAALITAINSRATPADVQAIQTALATLINTRATASDIEAARSSLATSLNSLATPLQVIDARNSIESTVNYRAAESSTRDNQVLAAIQALANGNGEGGLTTAELDALEADLITAINTRSTPAQVEAARAALATLIAATATATQLTTTMHTITGAIGNAATGSLGRDMVLLDAVNGRATPTQINEMRDAMLAAINGQATPADIAALQTALSTLIGTRATPADVQQAVAGAGPIPGESRLFSAQQIPAGWKIPDFPVQHSRQGYNISQDVVLTPYEYNFDMMSIPNTGTLINRQQYTYSNQNVRGAVFVDIREQYASFVRFEGPEWSQIYYNPNPADPNTAQWGYILVESLNNPFNAPYFSGFFSDIPNLRLDLLAQHSSWTGGTNRIYARVLAGYFPDNTKYRAVIELKLSTDWTDPFFVVVFDFAPNGIATITALNKITDGRVIADGGGKLMPNGDLVLMARLGPAKQTITIKASDASLADGTFSGSYPALDDIIADFSYQSPFFGKELVFPRQFSTGVRAGVFGFQTSVQPNGGYNISITGQTWNPAYFESFKTHPGHAVTDGVHDYLADENGIRQVTFNAATFEVKTNLVALPHPLITAIKNPRVIGLSNLGAALAMHAYGDPNFTGLISPDLWYRTAVINWSDYKASLLVNAIYDPAS